MTPRISVIVPTFHRPDLLERTLMALVAQELPSGTYEIVVGDDGCDPETRRLVQTVAGRSALRGGPDVRYVPVESTSGPAAARNRACAEARGQIFAFTDDDTIPAPGWLAAGARAIETGADAVAGRIDVPLPAARPTDYERDAAGLSRAEFATANCFVRARAFWELGGFDERFAAAWREDSDLQFRLLDAGFTIVSAPDAVVVHPVRPASWGVSLRQQRKSQYNALLYKKHRRRYRERIQGRPPIAYYLTLGALAGAVDLRARKPVEARILGLCWMVMCARFAARRLRGTERSVSHITEMTITSAAIPIASVFWRLRGALRFRVLFV